MATPRVLAFVALAVAYLSHLALEFSAGAAALAIGVAGLIAFLLLDWRRLARVGRLFALAALPIAALVLALAAEPVRVLAEALTSALFLGAFVAALGTLRIAGGLSPLLRRAGRHLFTQPPGRAYLALNVGSMLAATVLLFGVINLFGAMLVSEAGRKDAPEDRRARKRAMLAVLRGYAIMPTWSPLALPFALVSAYYPGVVWVNLLPFSLAAVALVSLAGLLADRIAFGGADGVVGPGAEADDKSAPALAQLVGLVLLLVTLVGGLAALTGWPMVRCVMIAVPLIAAVWLMALFAARGVTYAAAKAARTMAISLPEDRSAIAVMAGAGFCGVALGAVAPGPAIAAWLQQAAIPAALGPGFIILLFMAAGQIGLSPTLTFITLAVMLPDPSTLGLPPLILYVTVLAVWGLASISTPFSVPALVTGRFFRESPAAVVYQWSPGFLIGAPMLLAVFLGAATLWIKA